jgi:hypothetical protein
MVDILTIAKPQIWLEGIKVNGNSFSERVDHDKDTSPTSTVIIGGITQFDSDDILTFSNNVRVIITTMALPKVTYNRESGKLSALEFEGKGRVNIKYVNQLSETYYTLNGKDPVRTKANLYNYRDRNDTTTDTSDLGFVLSDSNVGNSLLTVKAVTYKNGKKSRIAIAKFRIVQTQNTLEFNNEKNQQV